MTMTRKQFLRTIVGVGAGAVAVAAIAGCGGDDGGGTPDAAASACTTPNTVIQTNHAGAAHVMTVALADVNAGVDKTYNIMGASLHTHSVTITAAQFTQIKNGQTLALTSTSGGAHTHAVTVMCVS